MLFSAFVKTEPNNIIKLKILSVDEKETLFEFLLTKAHVLIKKLIKNLCTVMYNIQLGLVLFCFNYH